MGKIGELGIGCSRRIRLKLCTDVSVVLGPMGHNPVGVVGQRYDCCLTFHHGSGRTDQGQTVGVDLNEFIHGSGQCYGKIPVGRIIGFNGCAFPDFFTAVSLGIECQRDFSFTTGRNLSRTRDSGAASAGPYHDDD